MHAWPSQNPAEVLIPSPGVPWSPLQAQPLPRGTSSAHPWRCSKCHPVPRLWRQGWREMNFCLSWGSRFLPWIIDGDKKVAFPGSSRWCSDNKAIFCNMVAPACPKERFVAGTVPVWLGAPEDGRVPPEPGPGWGSWEAPAALMSRGEESVRQSSAGNGGVTAQHLPLARHSPGEGPHLPGKYHCMFNSWHCKNIAGNAQLGKIPLPDPCDD